MNATERLHFLLPGDPETLTGGYLYDRNIVDGLGALGWEVRRHRLCDRFPRDDAAGAEEAAALLAELPDDALVVLDGLALAPLARVLAAEANRLRLVGLVHHPVADETGLEEQLRQALEAAEAEAYQALRRVIVTSTTTGARVRAMGMTGQRVGVVTPGIARPGRAPVASRLTEIRFVCAASLTPRKGHEFLLRALAGLKDHAWGLKCLGSADLDPGCARRLLELVQELGLQQRVEFPGAVSPAALSGHYLAADAMVLASLHEGYGMVLAEALVHGLPVIATRAGAIPEVVPSEAGLLVPPGDVAALRHALGRFLRDRTLRERLAEGARRTGAALPTWQDAARRFAAELRVA